MSDERPRGGFQRDVMAVVDAFKMGLQFDPPCISPTEFRRSLRFAGMPLDETDDLDPPDFEFPISDPTAEDRLDELPEEDDDDQ